MTHYFQPRLHLRPDHFLHSHLLEVLALGPRPHPRHDVQAGLKLEGAVGGHLHRYGIAGGHHQHTGLRHPGGSKHFLAVGGAEHGVVSVRTPLVEGSGVQVHHREGHVVFPHLLGHQGADPPQPADDHVPEHLPGALLPVGVADAVGPQHPEAPAQNRHQLGSPGYHRRACRHGQHCRHHDQRVEGLVHHTQGQRASHEDETELAYLSQPHSGQQGGAGQVTRKADYDAGYYELDHHRRPDDRQHLGVVVDDEYRVGQHPQRGEEQSGEHVSQGRHLRQRPVPDVRLAQQQPGHEGPQGGRQAHEIGQARNGEHQGHHHQDEHFPRAEQGDAAHHHGHDLDAQYGHAADYHHGLEHAQPDLAQHAGSAAGAVQGGQHGNHQDEHQVLHQKEAGQQPPVEAVDLAPVGQRFQHHHSAAQGAHHSQDDRRCRVESQDKANGSEQGGGNGNLQNAADDDHLAEADQFPEGDFDTDGEHQQHDANLGQPVHGVHIRDSGEVQPLVAGASGDVGTDDHAHGQVAQHGGSAERPGCHAAEEGGDDHGHQVNEKMALEVSFAHFLKEAPLKAPPFSQDDCKV